MLRLTLEEVIVKKISVEQFEEFVKWDPNVEWHGEYGGRFYYEGIAVTCESAADLIDLMVDIRDAGFDFPRWDHQDSMGLGMIVAWRPSVFAGNEKPSRADKHQWRTLGVSA